MSSRRCSCMRPVLVLIPVVLLSGVFAQPGTAQVADTRASVELPDVLTLDAALRIARENSPTYRRTLNDVDVASDAVRAAWAGFMPMLSTNMSFNGSRSTRTTGEDDFGDVVERPEATTFRSSSASQSISTQLTLFDGGATLATVRAERAMLAGTTEQIAAAAIQLDAQVRRAFHTAVRATRDIALEEQLLASARERLEHTRQLMALAARTRVDVLGAQEDVLTYEQSLERVRGEAVKARLELAVTLGAEPRRDFALDTVMPSIIDPAALDVDRLVADAAASSPVVAQREAAVRAARHRVSVASARRWPSVGVTAGYSRSASARDFGAFGDVDLPNSGLNFGLNVQYPLFDRFQTGTAVGSARAAEEDAAYDLRAARLAVESDIRSGVIDLINAHRALQLAQERAALSRERLELALEQYQTGGSTFTELQNVIDRTAQAERQALDAQFQFHMARIALEEVLGSPLEG